MPPQQIASRRDLFRRIEHALWDAVEDRVLRVMQTKGAVPRFQEKEYFSPRPLLDGQGVARSMARCQSHSILLFLVLNTDIKTVPPWRQLDRKVNVINALGSGQVAAEKHDAIDVIGEFFGLVDLLDTCHEFAELAFRRCPPERRRAGALRQSRALVR